MKSDIQIAQEASMIHIKDVAASIQIQEEDLEFYGKYKAKLSDDVYEKTKNNPDGKLVLVTAINPTPAGEGKTTTTVGLPLPTTCLPHFLTITSSRAMNWGSIRDRWYGNAVWI